MSRDSSRLSGWMEPIAQLLNAHESRGNFLIGLQTYRPHAVRMIASEFDLEFYDFRATYMMPMGPKAGQISLHRLDEVMSDCSKENGVIFHNVEALLATKTRPERATWLSQFVTRASGHPIVVPLSIFCIDAPAGSDRVAWIEPTEVPEEKLLIRLAQQ
jgi:hypothetical protein